MQKKPLILLAIFLFLSALIFINPGIPPINFVTNSIQSVFSVPKSTLTGAKTNLIQQEHGNLQEIEEENKRLTEKLIDFEKISRDNEALRSQFESADAPDYILRPAKVIGFLGKFSFPSSLIIDKGYLEGINVGMAVIVGNNLVGKISEVSGHYSEVVLVTSDKFSGLARSAEGNSPGIVSGASDFMVFDRVDVNDKLTTGELLLSKGEINDKGFGIPPDLIVGKIASINKSETLPFQSAKVESSIQFSKLDTVFVVLGL